MAKKERWISVLLVLISIFCTKLPRLSSHQCTRRILKTSIRGSGFLIRGSAIVSVPPTNPPSKDLHSRLRMSESDSLTTHSDMNDFMLKSHNSFQSDYGMDFGLPRDVLETMTNFSVSSPGMLSEDMRALEDEFRDEISLLNESPVSARSARLQALATRQRDRLVNAELDIAAYCAHQTVAENVNGDLSERLAGLSTAHVLVCLERDELRRFKQFAKPLVAVLVIVILLGLVGYLGHFFGV